MAGAIFLDRDGVLNEVCWRDGAAVSPRTMDEFVLIPAAVAAGIRLHRAGFKLVVITNQPDLERGLMAPESLYAMHRILTDALPIDRIEVCKHSGNQVCSCRKPAPGMILSAAAALGIDAHTSWTVGDRWADIAAGRAAGTMTILIERAYSWMPNSTDDAPLLLCPDHCADGLAEAVGLILDSGASQPVAP